MSGFSSMKRLGVYLYSPLDGMLVHRWVTPSIKFSGTHLHTWVERGTMRVSSKCFGQERNRMSPARSRTRTTRSAGERTNHETTAPPLIVYLIFRICIDSCFPIRKKGINRAKLWRKLIRAAFVTSRRCQLTIESFAPFWKLKCYRHRG